MDTKARINQLFDRLDDWRHLPAYQLERRADIFFAIYLNEIINHKFNHEIDFLIPEFPIRIGNLYPNRELNNPNLSFKIDYIAISNTHKIVYLIELKTDTRSLREKQNKYLDMAYKLGISKLVDGILDIYKVTYSKKKYGNLLHLLQKIGWIDGNKQNIVVDEYEIIIMFIQPEKSETHTTITFKDICGFLSEHNDDLTIRFIKSLKKWIINPND